MIHFVNDGKTKTKDFKSRGNSSFRRFILSTAQRFIVLTHMYLLVNFKIFHQKNVCSPGRQLYTLARVDSPHVLEYLEGNSILRIWVVDEGELLQGGQVSQRPSGVHNPHVSDQKPNDSLYASACVSCTSSYEPIHPNFQWPMCLLSDLWYVPVPDIPFLVAESNMTLSSLSRLRTQELGGMGSDRFRVYRWRQDKEVRAALRQGTAT